MSVTEKQLQHKVTMWSHLTTDKGIHSREALPSCTVVWGRGVPGALRGTGLVLASWALAVQLSPSQWKGAEPPGALEMGLPRH